MPPAAVPKATVYKHCDFQFGKHEIRAAGYRAMAPPSCYPVLSENHRQSKLSRSVAALADRRHDA
jgi:hypothetical protein